MTRIILTHVGTSLLSCLEWARGNTDVPRLRRTLEQTNALPSPAVQQTVRDDLQQFLREIWSLDGAQSDTERREFSPAEIASLSLLAPHPGDTVVLLHSQTTAGQFCAHELADLLRQNLAPDSGYPCCLPPITVECVEITGLHISSDGRRTSAQQQAQEVESGEQAFVRVGLVNYVDRVWTYFRKLTRTHDVLLFNITGGYKGMIPIARDLALLLAAYSRDEINRPIKSEVCYLYETGGDLIRYGALPVKFVWSPTLRDYLEQAAFPAGTAYARLPVLEQYTEWEPFFEEVRQNPEQPSSRIRRSALGEVVLALYKQMYPDGRV
jgi:hypothetical protein